jgi:phosphohistidine phosphatase SixA
VRSLVAVLIVCLAVVAGCTDVAPPEVSAAPLEGAALGEALQRGGYVLFWRHTTSDGSHDQGAPPQVTDCGRQRNLSSSGRADAERVGDAMRRVGVAVGDVRASPFCRTVDTATLAFGDVTEDDRLLQGESAASAAALAELLSQRPSRGNTVLVGHVGNIGAAAGIHIEEGEVAVFAPGGDGDFALVATVGVDGWDDLAR